MSRANTGATDGLWSRWVIHTLRVSLKMWIIYRNHFVDKSYATTDSAQDLGHKHTVYI